MKDYSITNQTIHNINAPSNVFMINITNGNVLSRLSVIAKYYQLKLCSNYVMGEALDTQGFSEEAPSYDPKTLGQKQYSEKIFNKFATCAVSDASFYLDSETKRLCCDSFEANKTVMILFFTEDEELKIEDIEVTNV